MSKLNLSLVNTLLITTGSLAACNSGSSTVSNSNTPVDVQITSVNYSVDNSNLSIGLTANNCLIITQNGSCNVSLTYNGTGDFIGESIQLVLPVGYTQSSPQCPAVTSETTNCNLVVSATSSADINQAQTVNVEVNQARDYYLSFNIGGGI